MTIHRELEERLAELKGYEACVLFGCGFLANTGVIAALATDGVVASDELNHASIVDGCRLARATTLVYPHGEVPDGADVIVTDGVFSMDGDIADLAALVETGARVIVDEAHATGVIGPEGRGLVHELGLQEHVITVGTLGKALGSYGAFVCCDRETADYLVNRARTMIYSTALPPPSIGAALKALDLMDAQLVGKLHANARTLREALRRRGQRHADRPADHRRPRRRDGRVRGRAAGGLLRPGDPPARPYPRAPRGCDSSPWPHIILMN